MSGTIKAAFVRRVVSLRPGKEGTKAKYLQVMEVDHQEPAFARVPKRGLWDAFAHLNWEIPEDFDAPDPEIEQLFEGLEGNET